MTCGSDEARVATVDVQPEDALLVEGRLLEAQVHVRSAADDQEPTPGAHAATSSRWAWSCS